MKTLRFGTVDPLVEKIQGFLRGQGLYMGKFDPIFSPLTEAAVKLYEKRKNLRPDGVVDDDFMTFAIADGFSLLGESRDFPSKPGFGPLTAEDRQNTWGRIECVATPQAGNPEAIRLTNRWQSEYLTQVHIPQFERLALTQSSFPKNGRVFWNQLGVQSLINFWSDVEDEGCLEDVLTFAGTWALRYVRGVPGLLSNHAHAVAFDINVAWNQLGVKPSSGKGSVYRLVPIAHRHGFFWGGFFGRPDAMHFELVIPDGETVPKTLR